MASELRCAAQAVEASSGEGDTVGVLASVARHTYDVLDTVMEAA
ncbi:hypothetical protein P3T36_003374 [Kitasatospora sp. MAP12-15]|nr:hypothetical protein [Kitasatospora sp. MAP12-44]MDH6111351.1 hypothetical protein [Kitasatospora sp. MAP12-44]